MEIDVIEISCRELIPPIGRTYKYYATVQFFYAKTETGRVKIEHDFGEVLGQTEEEAKDRMQDKVDEWVKSHDS